MSLHAKVLSQEAKVTLDMKNVALTTVLEELGKQSKCDFFYNYALMQSKGMVNVKAENLELGKVLEELLPKLGLTFTFDQNVIVIREKVSDEKSKFVRVKGYVYDIHKQGMPGVTVKVAGLPIGTSTNSKGWFVLDLPLQKGSLEFSFVGYKKQIIDFSQKTAQDTLYVTLEEDSQKMEEVVVTGYQTVNRRDMVGAHKTLKASDILMPAYSSIDQMLQGQVAGLMVVNTSSRVGTSPKIKLRGTSTILGNQSPLWVVDGIVQEDPLELEVSSSMTQDLKDIIGSQVSWLNPMDIETITVLKDASATAIYGSKASNGVIVITTKKGKASQLTINYSGNMTINTRPNYGMFNYMNSKERIQFSQDVFNAGMRYSSEPFADPYTYEGAMQMYIAGDMTRDEFAKRKAFLETVNTDWFDLLTRSAVSHNHNLSFRGGNETITYNVSLGYSNSLGQEIGNESEKMTGRVSVDTRLHEKVRLNTMINVSSTETNAFGAGVNPMSYATTTSRAIPAYDEKGDPVYYNVSSMYSRYNSVKMLKYNFINERDNGGSTSRNFYASANLNFKWEILDGLSYEFVGGYTSNNTNSESYMTEQSFYVANSYRGYEYGTVEATDPLYKAAMLPFGGVLVTSDATQRSYNIQNKILFSKNFDENHRLNVMIAMELRSGKKIVNGNTVFGYLPERGETVATPTLPSDFTSMGTATISGWAY